MRKHKTKILITILILFLASLFLPAALPVAKATDGGGSWAQFAQYAVKEFGFDLAARVIANFQLSGSLKGIAQQVLQSGRTGRTPAFIQNWRNLMTDGQYRGEDVFRAVLGNTTQCPYFRNEILNTFGVRSILPIPGNTQNIRVNNLDPFTVRGNCTMPQAWSIRNYQKDFSGNGGWDALVRLSQPQNNFYGSLLLSMNELNAQRGIDSNADIQEGGSASGYTGIRRSTVTNGSSCDTPPDTRSLCEECVKTQKWCLPGGGPLSNSCVPLGDSSCTYSTQFPSGCTAIPSTIINSQARCTFLGDVVSPADILGKSASQFIDKRLSWFTSSDELSEVIGNYIGGLIDQLANFAANKIAGNVHESKKDNYLACTRTCNNTSSGKNLADCYNRCLKEADIDAPNACNIDGSCAPTGPPPPPTGGVCLPGPIGFCDPGEDIIGCPRDCTPVPPCTPTCVTTDDRLSPGETLSPGQSVTSANGRYSLLIQGSSGPVVILDNNATPPAAIWTWISQGNPLVGNQLEMGTEGYFSLYNNPPNLAGRFNTSSPGAYLTMQDDGLAVFRTSAGVAIFTLNNL